MGQLTASIAHEVNLGTGVSALASQDGSTILAVVPDFLIQPLVKAKIPYDPFTSFVPVTMAVSAPEMISVNTAVPANNFKELVELLRATPGKFQYATPGFGTPPHLYGESVYHLTLGLDVTHVPFQGAAPSLERDHRRAASSPALVQSPTPLDAARRSLRKLGPAEHFRRRGIRAPIGRTRRTKSENQTSFSATETP